MVTKEAWCPYRCPSFSKNHYFLASNTLFESSFVSSAHLTAFRSSWSTRLYLWNIDHCLMPTHFHDDRMMSPSFTEIRYCSMTEVMKYNIFQSCTFQSIRPWTLEPFKWPVFSFGIQVKKYPIRMMHWAGQFLKHLVDHRMDWDASAFFLTFGPSGHEFYDAFS